VTIKTQCGRQRPARQQPCPTPSTKQAAPLSLGTCLPALFTSHLEVPFCSFNCPGCLLSCACPLSYPVLSGPGTGAVAVLAGKKPSPSLFHPKPKPLLPLTLLSLAASLLFLYPIPIDPQPPLSAKLTTCTISQAQAQSSSPFTPANSSISLNFFTQITSNQ
jgi:hypothetical protein